MSRARGPVVATVVVVLVALVSWWPGSPVRSDDELVAAPVPAAGPAEGLSSTWYCPGGWTGEGEVPLQTLAITDPSGQGAPVRISAFGADGPLGSTEAEVPDSGVLGVRTEDAFEVPVASLLVESTAPELVVEQRQRTTDASDQVPCAAASSSTWYFPAQTTVLGSSARLVLFNPFSEDAGVDVSAAVPDGVRVPGPWQGVIVPAGTARVLDLGAEIQRREQFALTVESRTGQVVAQTVQVLDTEDPTARGLRLQLGVPRAASDWALAQGFVGPGVTERLVVLNPGERPAPVAVQVTPFGGAELPPEPFELEVPAGRYAEIELSAESRVPATGFHAVRVQSEPSTPVVVGRVVGLSGAGDAESTPEAPARPSLERGTAIGTGSPVVAELWLATGLSAARGREPMLFVHNPAAEPVVVSAVVLGGPADGTTVADAVEVPAGDSVAVVPDAEVGDAPFSVLVEAATPVVVERTVTWPDKDDLSMGLAVPLSGTGPGPRPIGG